jgi:hypothetical protein
MTLKRKKAKPRARGTGCQFGRRCIAIGEYQGKRVCAKHWADALFAAETRDACDGNCWLNGTDSIACNGRLQCAHIISRRYLAIRWADDNAMPLCSAHHVYYTHHPLEWEQLCISIGVDWEDLRRRALYDPPMDPLAVIERLKEAV